MAGGNDLVLGKGRLIFVLVTPSDKARIGVEAQRLVNWVDTLGKYKPARDRFESVVRRGFAHNFDVEGVPSNPWQELAERTKNERAELMTLGVPLVPGFTEEHPILQRTGVYRSSWVDAEDAQALLELERPQEGDMFMHIGSSDPRVPILSAGESAPLGEALAIEGLEYTQAAWEEAGAEAPHPWAHIPPRPVNEMFEAFEAELTALADSLGQAFARAASRT